MRVGVTAHFQFSVFSGGGSLGTLSVAETMKMMGHDVTIINTNGTQEWWDDLPSLKQLYPRINVGDIKEPFDIVLEVGNTLADKETRHRVGNHCVWVIRRPVLLSDIEHSIFPVSLGKRNLEGLSAVWCFDQEIFDDEIQYLETLARVPVRKVPFVWTPSIVEIHRKETGMPHWIQVAVAAIQQAQKMLPWSVHVCETNNSAMSSCTIPVVALREAKKQGQFIFSRYKIHNAQPVEHSAFFKQNVYNHCQIEGLSGEFLGRQRIVDWTVDPMSCILGHLRFRRIRPYMLDAIWCGIPLVHNSPVLRDLGSGYENYFYEDNSIVGASKALLQVQTDMLSAKGMFQQGAYASIQQKILERFSPISTFVHNGWREAIASLPSVRPNQTLFVAPTPAPTPPTPSAIVSSPSISTSKTDETPILRVLFTDMWDDFNPAYNMFLLIMREGSKNVVPRPHIEGYSLQTLPDGVKPNILLFGPFGKEYQDDKWKDIPKAHYTGENTKPVMGPNIFLNMGYPHAEFIDESYIRLPLWMLEIDWFGADLEKIKNPKPLPLDRCTKVFPDEIPKKERFCAFVVTNPCNPVRNSAFHWLSQYKRIDSAGRLFNNIGDEIFAGLGGGGGELKKHEFLKKYKFCLAYENSSSQGYTTEKLLHAKIAGCIPIYWGDPKVERDFDTKGFIDARAFTTPEELVEAVRKIDTDAEAYKKMFSIPALDEYKRDLVRRTLSMIAYKLLHASMPSIKHEQIPRFLGATSTEEAFALRKEREGTVDAIPTPSIHITDSPSLVSPKIRVLEAPRNTKTELAKQILVASMASLRFLPSLHQMLSALYAQKQAVDGLEARIWLARDVPEVAEKTLTESFPFAKFIRLPESDVPAGFPDYWSPEHFAWKLWIYNQLAQDTTLQGRLIFYMDSGIFMCRWPRAWLQIVMEEGICALHDPRETNGRWCHETFCRVLQVTPEEKESNQIIAGCLAFVGGNEKARRLFAEAYDWSKKRDVIVGAKWEGVRDGKPFGHRHDQSILSILTQRHGIPRYPLDNIYCDHSLRKTFLSGKALYVHRGAFTVHKPFASQIDDAFVINLERRPDRMEKMFKANPELKDRVQRLVAYDGKQVQLTPAIARLFKPNDFFWKKAILGCALSHLNLWWQLVHERPEIHNYLILEDDCKLQAGWEEKWNAAAGYIPDDYDVVYLGGILPPNRAGFETVKERVNDHFSRVAPNQIFGQRTPNRYFHWCNYSYILSRKGAEKILQILFDNGGYWTSADHMVCNRVDALNHYFLDPLVAGCYQDEDPKYQTSAFNDFNRVDAFDSDLWNNDERFSVVEIESMLKSPDAINIDIAKALSDGRTSSPTTEKRVSTPDEKKEEVVIGQATNNHDLVKEVMNQISNMNAPKEQKRCYVTLEQHDFKGASAYEREWMEELLGKDLPFLIQKIKPNEAPPCENPIVIVQRPHIDAYNALFLRWEAQKIPFSVFHVSDEYVSDDLSFYTLEMCKGIVRMYNRADIPAAAKNKTKVIPLGYHWTTANSSDDPLNKTPRLPFRNNVWSFYGTGWKDRAQLLAPLTQIQPNLLKLMDSWESPEKLTQNQYIAILLDTIFVPCPGGNNIETFRLYEALECGCIPLYVKTQGDDAYVEMLQNEIGILPVSSWQEAAVLMLHFMKEKEIMENYRNSLLTRWRLWKQRLGQEIKQIWKL